MTTLESGYNGSLAELLRFNSVNRVTNSDPNGNVLPLFNGEVVLDVSTDQRYIAKRNDTRRAWLLIDHQRGDVNG